MTLPANQRIKVTEQGFCVAVLNDSALERYRR